MVMGVSTPSSAAPYVPFDLGTVSGGGHRPTLGLDLDLMARIAEQAGRDALRTGGVLGPGDADSALRAIGTDGGMRVTATRLYRACRSGASDPATLTSACAMTTGCSSGALVSCRLNRGRWPASAAASQRLMTLGA
jgi:hypothetical protein